MLLEDGEQVVKLLVHGIFLAVVAHPLDGEGAAATDHAHEALVIADPLQGASGDAAMDGHEIDPILGLLLDDLEHMVDGNLADLFLLLFHDLGDGLIDGYGSQGDRTILEDFPADGVELAAHGKIHHRIGAGLEADAELLQLLFHLGIIAGRADIGVDLGGETLAHGHDFLKVVVFVLRDADGALGHPLHEKLRGDSLRGGAGSEKRGEGLGAGVFSNAHCLSPVSQIPRPTSAGTADYGLLGNVRAGSASASML